MVAYLHQLWYALASESAQWKTIAQWKKDCSIMQDAKHIFHKINYCSLMGCFETTIVRENRTILRDDTPLSHKTTILNSSSLVPCHNWGIQLEFFPPCAPSWLRDSTLNSSSLCAAPSRLRDLTSNSSTLSAAPSRLRDSSSQIHSHSDLFNWNLIRLLNIKSIELIESTRVKCKSI